MDISIVAALDQLAELKAEIDIVAMNRRDARDAILVPVAVALANCEAEYDARISALDEAIAETEKAIRDAVLQTGSTVKGAHMQAIYAKGRASWDTKGLDGYAVAHPEINVFRSVGQPSVSIRKG